MELLYDNLDMLRAMYTDEQLVKLWKEVTPKRIMKCMWCREIIVENDEGIFEHYGKGHWVYEKADSIDALNNRIRLLENKLIYGTRGK